jgi:hypothetical protein
MDHEEMRSAYIRAIATNVDDISFTVFCNTCKTDYQNNTGKTEDLFVSSVLYKLWYCDLCIEKEFNLSC